MGWLLYLSAMLWGIMGADFGVRTVHGLICYLIAATFFVGGAVVFAINDAAASTQPPQP